MTHASPPLLRRRRRRAVECAAALAALAASSLPSAGASPPPRTYGVTFFADAACAVPVPPEGLPSAAVPPPAAGFIGAAAAWSPGGCLALARYSLYSSSSTGVRLTEDEPAGKGVTLDLFVSSDESTFDKCVLANVRIATAAGSRCGGATGPPCPAFDCEAAHAAGETCADGDDGGAPPADCAAGTCAYGGARRLPLAQAPVQKCVALPRQACADTGLCSVRVSTAGDPDYLLIGLVAATVALTVVAAVTTVAQRSQAGHPCLGRTVDRIRIFVLDAESQAAAGTVATQPTADDALDGPVKTWAPPDAAALPDAAGPPGAAPPPPPRAAGAVPAGEDGAPPRRAGAGAGVGVWVRAEGYASGGLGSFAGGAWTSAGASGSSSSGSGSFAGGAWTRTDASGSSSVASPRSDASSGSIVVLHS